MTYALEALYTNDKPPAVLRTPEDVDRFVDELLAAGWEHAAAAIYVLDGATPGLPDHEIIIGVDAVTGLGALRHSRDGTWYSRGGRTNPDGVEFAYFGTGHEFPADSEVPLDTVRQAMRELLAHGPRRPGCLAWQGG